MNPNMIDKKKDRPFVFVRCLTYNHEKYIEDALKGFLMQKTDFPFLAVVIDDCSTDGTADIVRRYEPNILTLSKVFIFHIILEVAGRINVLIIRNISTKPPIGLNAKAMTIGQICINCRNK